ncbi:hypothetical protein AB0H67_34435 [Streptomyces phaeochromogenes]
MKSYHSTTVEKAATPMEARDSPAARPGSCDRTGGPICGGEAEDEE